MTCPYINTLERECGREATHDGFCDLHRALSLIDSLDSVDDLFTLLDLVESRRK